MSDFRGEATPAPEFQPGFCTNLKDDISRGHEGFASKSPIATLLHDLIGDDPTGIFPSAYTLRQSARTDALPIGCLTVSITSETVRDGWGLGSYMGLTLQTLTQQRAH